MRPSSGGPVHEGAARAWDIAIKLLVPLSLIAAGAMVNHEVRLSRIEESRFTQQDGYILEEKTASAEDVRDVKRLLEALDSRTRSIEQTAARLESILEKDR